MKKRKSPKYMYGKFHHDTYEFHRNLQDLFSDLFKKYPTLDMKLHNNIIELRNKIVALLDSWIGSKKIETKFGIKIPLTNTPPSIESFLEKQVRSYHKKYRPCEVCGENRITHFCHIIPRSEGGPNDENNYLYLCPIHHHLFDHYRLNKDEWDKIDFSKKSESSQEYVKKVTLLILEKNWKK
jgi:HNH endonuclease